MCGIAGLIDRRLAGQTEPLAARARAMADALRHRGPDGDGVWTDAEAGLALSHRRLAIIDLTPAGAQPMVSADGRWAISYNGEVYNARAIARGADLVDVAWRGTSDTEVIVESVARRGLDRTLADLNGMFALALWDRRDRVLHLVRDRMGIKPLFFRARGGNVCFASELKSLAAAGMPLGGIDPSAVASFLRFGYVPSPHAIFRDVEKVMPGEVVSIAGAQVTRRRYWSLADAARAGIDRPLDVTDDEAIGHLRDLLSDAVSAQMIADVPLGAFLSGGIDSSVVTALMVAADRGPVRTYSIGFPELGFDESQHAAAVAAHLGTQHEQLIVTTDDALALVPQLPEMYDEPFADSSQIPTALVSRMTRRHVTVALSGDGGDELFCGYNRYWFAERLDNRLQRVPTALRRMLARGLEAIPDRAIDGVASLLPARLVPAQPADKLKKAATVLPLDAAAIYQRLVSQCPDPGALMAAREYPMPWNWETQPGADRMQRMQLIDMATYLPDDILQKVDRASMAYALEARPPLLDHRVVEFALRLPRRLRIRDGETKWILRQLLDRYVPRALVERPKMGFGVPLADWLRGPLRDWAADLLDPAHFAGGLIDADAAGALWQEHLSGRRNWAYALWTLLMFEAWRRRWAVA